MFEKKDKDEFLEDLITKLPGHIYWKDIHGVLHGCNDAQARFIGLNSSKDIVGLTAYDTLPKAVADKVTLNDQEVIHSKKAQKFEEVYMEEGIPRSYWHSEKRPIITKNGIVIGILGISFDITAQKQLAAEKAEKEALKKQVQLSEMIAATIAHEVRTPLSSIQISAAAIKNAVKINDMTQVIEICQEIRDHLRSTNTFIDMFLRNIRDTQSISTEGQASIEQTVTAVVENYAYTQEKDKSLIKPAADFKDFIFACNQPLMEHVLENLFKNALYFVKKAGKGQIQLFTSVDEPYNCLHFKDTGTGIAAEILPRIFEKFYTSTDVGSGVGLSFCKMILESIDGKITCDSVLGEYTEFKLYFPKILD